MRVAVTFEADLGTITDATYVAPRTVVALPPSDIDPIWDEMRVLIQGVLISRAYDPGDAIVTGAPIPLVTMSGEPLVTMSGEELVTVVA